MDGIRAIALILRITWRIQHLETHPVAKEIQDIGAGDVRLGLLGPLVHDIALGELYALEQSWRTVNAV